MKIFFFRNFWSQGCSSYKRSLKIYIFVFDLTFFRYLQDEELEENFLRQVCCPSKTIILPFEPQKLLYFPIHQDISKSIFCSSFFDLTVKALQQRIVCLWNRVRNGTLGTICVDCQSSWEEFVFFFKFKLRILNCKFFADIKNLIPWWVWDLWSIFLSVYRSKVHMPNSDSFSSTKKKVNNERC